MTRTAAAAAAHLARGSRRRRDAVIFGAWESCLEGSSLGFLQVGLEIRRLAAAPSRRSGPSFSEPGKAKEARIDRSSRSGFGLSELVGTFGARFGISVGPLWVSSLLFMTRKVELLTWSCFSESSPSVNIVEVSVYFKWDSLCLCFSTLIVGCRNSKYDPANFIKCFVPYFWSKVKSNSSSECAL